MEYLSLLFNGNGNLFSRTEALRSLHFERTFQFESSTVHSNTTYPCHLICKGLESQYFAQISQMGNESLETKSAFGKFFFSKYFHLLSFFSLLAKWRCWGLLWTHVSKWIRRFLLIAFFCKKATLSWEGKCVFRDFSELFQFSSNFSL